MSFRALDGRTLVAGTRSTRLWALAQHRRGGDGAVLLGGAAAAGFDLSPLRLYRLR